MADIHENQRTDLTTPVRSGEVVDISGGDHTFTNTTRALWVGDTGTSGTVVVQMADGSDLTFVGVPTGTLLPIRALAVRQTGTDAASMVGVW